MKYSRGTFLLGCALVAGSTAVSAQTLEPSRISRIDELVAKAMSELPIRGVSIVATRAGTTVFDRAYGFADGETKVAATSSTRYPVGSITKSFTAAAILALRDSKRIDLDAPIGRYVPEAGKGSAVPIRLLLEQRSGIPNFFGDYVWERNLRNATAAEMLATMASAPLDFVPGALFEYPNTNYLLLGLAIERITKQPYFSVLKRLVTIPPGCKRPRLSANRIHHMPSDTSALRIPPARRLASPMVLECIGARARSFRARAILPLGMSRFSMGA